MIRITKIFNIDVLLQKKVVTDKKKLCGLTAAEIFELIEPWGYSLSHAVAITNSLYKVKASGIAGISKIPKALKEKLSLEFEMGVDKPVRCEKSADGAIKYLFQSDSGLEFETVYIPDGKRNTVCVSAQSGCRMGCSFCATASYGFRGNLSAGEILSQVIGIPEAGRITHVVFMGMGEPLDNYDNVLKSCEIINSEWGKAISRRNVTVSTVGLLIGIEKFLNNSQCNLTLSLHSPFPEERKQFVPVEKFYPSGEIIRLMKEYPRVKKRRFSLAYVMIDGVNDSDEHLQALRELITGSEIRINLLPYHPTEKGGYKSSSPEKMNYFKHNLMISGISASVRKSRGSDISAACGLLASFLKR